MGKTLKNLALIKYYAFQREPFEPDAEGYAKWDDLKDFEKNPYYIKWVDDVPVARKGYTLVRADEGVGQYSWYAIKSNAIYSVAIPHSGLSGGWGLYYPGGGLSATAYNYEHPIKAEIDGEEVYLKRFYW